MIGAFTKYTVQPRYAPHVLWVVTDFQPLRADENGARPRLLGLRIVGDAHRIQIEIVILRTRKEPDGVMHRRKPARAAAPRRHAPVPDDLVEHHHALLEHHDNLG